MQNKFKPSIYLEPTSGGSQSAHALTANVKSRQGFNLHVAAVSQKKPGQYTKIDTPRKTLLSFVTSLQSGSDNSLDKLIQRAVGLATISTGGYVKRRGGAPCSLAAAILLENQLYTIQIGAGEILYQYGDKFDLLTSQRSTTATWLGESRNFSLETINFQKTELFSASTVLVCQAGFLQTAKNDYKAFKQAVSAYSQRSDDLAQDLAQWATSNGVESGLTMAAYVAGVQRHQPSQNSIPFSESGDVADRPAHPEAAEKADDQNEESASAEPHEPSVGPRVTFEEASIGAEPLLSKDSDLPNGKLGGGYDGAELNVGDEVVSTIIFDTLIKRRQPSNTADTAPVIPTIQPKEEDGTNNNGVIVNDTVRTTALDISPIAPIRTNGIVEHHSVPVEMTALLSESTEVEATPPVPDLHRSKPSIDRFYRLLAFASVAIFLAMIGTGIVVILQRAIFNNGAAEGGTNNLVEVVDASLEVEPVIAEPSADVKAVGLLSQGASTDAMTIFSDQRLDARGLIHFAINNSGDNNTTDRDRNVFIWAGSTINFENTTPGTQFGVEEKSNIFIDSTKGTVRPELTELFGVAESSAGCMSIDYRSAEDPLVISCYAGTCRWLGPLNRNYEIPAGQRLELDSNLRAEDPASFEPVYFTETSVFARTLGGVPAGKEIANQCLEPFLAEGKQLTGEQTSAVADSMALNIAQEMGWWRAGNSPRLNELQKGDTVNVRGLTRFTLAVNVAADDGTEEINEHELYAWPGSGLHFNPELDENQFDVGEGSSLFLNSTDSVIRPFFPDLFGTAESADGCMAITFQSAEKPLVLSCYSGSCAWKGALNRNYTIPIGQRLELASNPRVEELAKLQPIYRTETAVVARTLGSIPAGLEISNRCVEPYLINPESVIIVPLATLAPEPSPTPLATETAEPTAEAEPTLPPLETPNSGESDAADETLEGTPEADVDPTSDTLAGS